MEKLIKKIFVDLWNDPLDQNDFDNLCMDQEEIEKYRNGEWDPLIIFEGDPDYMITPDGNVIYFIIIGSTVYYIDISGSNDYLKELEEFCNGQNPKVSLGGYNTRLGTKHWKYLEENDRDGWENCKNLKIAYRGGCGYVYTLFEYIN